MGLVEHIFVIQVVDVLDATHSTLEVDRELIEGSELRVVHQGVDTRVRFPALLLRLHSLSLNNASLEYVYAGLDDVQFDESSVSLFVVVNSVEVRSVKPRDIADAAEPVLKESEILSFQRGCLRLQTSKSSGKIINHL